MGKKLIITEKPSVAMEYAKILKTNTTRKNGYLESDEYIITWCVGHLVTMSYPEKYDISLKYWRLETLPFIPKNFKYEVIAQVEEQFNIVKSLLTRSDLECIYVGTDSGREGEYIYRLVDQMVGVTCNNKKRIWIDSQTEEAILNGIKEAKNLSEYNDISNAAYLRAKEDYLIGINFSRLISLAYSDKIEKFTEGKIKSISIGRVMTCVLGLIVDREREIRNFTKTTFYKIQGSFLNTESPLIADWKVTENSSLYNSHLLYNDTGFKKEEDAIEFINNLKACNKKPVITDISKKKQKENAPLLYNLAELQNECTKKFKISPDKTLDIAQELYEKKLVTYPRTDARVLSTAVAKEISKNLNGIFKGNKNEEIAKMISKIKEEKYSTNLLKTKYVNDSKITDHYAIIPTRTRF